MTIKCLSGLRPLCLLAATLLTLAIPVVVTAEQPTLDEKQQVYLFSSLSNAVSDMKGDQDTLQAQLHKYVSGAINDEVVQGYIGKWQLVWGPVVTNMACPIIPNCDQYSANTLFVVQKGNQYVVATAGTNPSSAYGWIWEDGYVYEKVVWPYGEVDSDAVPMISAGTHTGLKILLKMQSSGQTVLEFLNAINTDVDAPKKVIFTGHSLGGALSPALALAIKQQTTANLQISVYPSAGPTPGDKNFSDYYDNILGAATTRIWNKIDVVPHAWDETMLAEIPSLYEPDIKGGNLVRCAVKAAEWLALDENYTQLLPATPGLPGQVEVPPPNICDLPALSMADATFHKQLATHLQQKVAENPEYQRIIDQMIQAESTAKIEVTDAHRQKLIETLSSNFLTFFAQLSYQHTTSYHRLLDVVEPGCYIGKHYMYHESPDEKARTEKNAKLIIKMLKKWLFFKC